MLHLALYILCILVAMPIILAVAAMIAIIPYFFIGLIGYTRFRWGNKYIGNLANKSHTERYEMPTSFRKVG